jgi:5'-3' exonuclease
VTRRLLLDVSSLMYRAFFAMGETVNTPDGKPVGAVHGYLDMVARLVNDRRPDEVVHVYDHEWRPTARTDIYPGYKSQRLPDPPALPPQFEMLRLVLEHTGTIQAQTRGWEAEDAIAAFCLDAGKADRIEIVSGDRDLIQLVRDPVVKLLFTLRGVSDLAEYDEAGVLAKFGVPASRYAEFAILRGDPSDSLPGVRGVGEKTARALVQTYGSLEEILDDADRDTPRPGPLKGKPALRARLREATDYIAKMREIVPPNGIAPLDLWGGERDNEALKKVADELAVRGPAQRLAAALDAASQ